MPGSVNQELSYFLWPKGCRLNQRKGREIKSDHRVQKNFTKLHFFFLTWENEEERREQCRNTLLMMALSSKSMVKKWLAKKKKKEKNIIYIFYLHSNLSYVTGTKITGEGQVLLLFKGMVSYFQTDHM